MYSVMRKMLCLSLAETMRLSPPASALRNALKARIVLMPVLRDLLTTVRFATLSKSLT